MEVMRKVIKKLILSILIYSIFTTISTYAKGDFEIIGKATMPHGQNYELTKLNDGRILISEYTQVNYYTNSPIPEKNRFITRFEIYNPKIKKFEKITQPRIWHYYHTKPVVLDDGKVLLVGSFCSMGQLEKDVTPFQLKQCTESQYAEVYDPINDTYKTVGKLQVPRSYFGITKLNNGKVLITNGISEYIYKYDKNGKVDYYKTNGNKPTTRFSEIYDPKTETFTLNSETAVDIRRKYVKVGNSRYEYDYYINNIKSKPKPEYSSGDLRNKLPIQQETIYEVSQNDISKQTVILDNSEVLVLWLHLSAAEIYNPVTNTFKRLPNFQLKFRDSRNPEIVHKIPDGRIVIIGGQSTRASYNAIEILDPEAETVEYVGTIPITGDGIYHSLLLPSGKILIYGGVLRNNSIWKGYDPIHSMLLYDPITNTTEIIDKSPKDFILGKSIILDDGSIFFIANIKGKGYGVIYKNKELQGGNL